VTAVIEAYNGSPLCIVLPELGYIPPHRFRQEGNDLERDVVRTDGCLCLRNLIHACTLGPRAVKKKKIIGKFNLAHGSHIASSSKSSFAVDHGSNR
jgi:hypothetical protein